jgi:hypothetical protein
VKIKNKLKSKFSDWDENEEEEIDAYDDDGSESVIESEDEISLKSNPPSKVK